MYVYDHCDEINDLLLLLTGEADILSGQDLRIVKSKSFKLPTYSASHHQVCFLPFLVLNKPSMSRIRWRFMLYTDDRESNPYRFNVHREIITFSKRNVFVQV